VGLIDFEEGHLVIPVLYNEIFEFKALTASSYKIAKVNRNGKYGFVNMDGEEIISPIYDEIKDFNNGYASFRINNKWGLINSFGKETINSSYDEPLSFNGNETYATLNGSKVKIDRFGNRINETPVYAQSNSYYDVQGIYQLFEFGSIHPITHEGNNFYYIFNKNKLVLVAMGESPESAFLDMAGGIKSGRISTGRYTINGSDMSLIIGNTESSWTYESMFKTFYKNDKRSKLEFIESIE
jgi:hypothetical protein